MKIVITVNTYHPLKDGVQFVTQYHAERLAQKGHEVVVLTVNHGHSNEEVHNKVKIVRFDISVKHTLYFGERKKYINRLREELLSADALINVCAQTATTDWCFPILKDIKCKKILYMHGMHSHKFTKHDLVSLKALAHKIWNNARWNTYYKLSGKYFKQYDHIVQLHENDYANTYFDKKYHIKSVVIENAADDLFFEPEINKENYIINVSNYLPRKNQELLLRAFYKGNIDNKYGLILIGGEANKYYHRLLSLRKKLENRYGHKNVKILYGLNREETIKKIKKAGLYVQTSAWEAFPISIIEAMASGTPFISTDTGIVKYLPGGIVANSEQDISYWIKLLLNNQKLSALYGEIGNTYAKNKLSIDNKVNDLEKLLNK